MIRANVQDQTLTLRYDDVISDSSRYLEIEFTFNSVWRAKTKVAVFRNGDTELNVIFLDGNSMYLGNNKCYVPSEVIKHPGFSVSIYGVENNVLITTNEATVEVQESSIGYLQPAEPTPSLWNQILLSVNPAARVPSGGTTGQVLQKNSNGNYDTSWKTIDTYTRNEANSYFVPKTLKVNNKPLNADINLDPTDIGAYALPVGGIPESDLSSDVQASLGKADTAIQEHQSLASKQDVLESGVNIKTLNNRSLLGSGNIDLPATFSPLDEIIWRAPRDFGAKVNGVVGSNIKVYRDINDEILVFLGAGRLYGSDLYSDSYIIDCICGHTNTTVRKIYIQNGIINIGANLFNRFYSGDSSYGRDKYWNVKNPANSWSPTGTVTTSIILPPTVRTIEKRAFEYCNISETIIINCNNSLSIEADAFHGAGFANIYIKNATGLTGYNANTFTLSALKNFEISCEIPSTIGFSISDKLTVDSLINIANHLRNVLDSLLPQGLILHANSKALCNTTRGNVQDEVFVKNAEGAVTLTDFITNTKGWTIA